VGAAHRLVKVRGEISGLVFGPFRAHPSESACAGRAATLSQGNGETLAIERCSAAKVAALWEGPERWPESDGALHRSRR
jgi:hypothetical protein